MPTNSPVSNGIDGLVAVMAVTLPCDAGYSSPSRLMPILNTVEGTKIQKDERDVLEILKIGRMP